MLLATAGREELSVPNAMPCPTGDRSCKRCSGGGQWWHCAHSVGVGVREGHTVYYALYLELSKTSFYLSFSLLPLFFSLSSSRLDFYFVYFFFLACSRGVLSFFPFSSNAYLTATI